MRAADPSAKPRGKARTAARTKPVGLLEGEGKTGRHLKLRTMGDLPREAVQRWLRAAAQLARAKAAHG